MEILIFEKLGKRGEKACNRSETPDGRACSSRASIKRGGKESKK